MSQPPTGPRGERPPLTVQSLEDFIEPIVGESYERSFVPAREAEHRRSVEIIQLEAKKEADKGKRVTNRIIFVFAMVGFTVAVVTCSCVALGIVKANDSQRTQSITGAVGLVTGLLGFLAGKNIE